MLNHLIGSSTLSLFQSWQVPLSTIRIINSCFLPPLAAQILAETRLSIHDSPFPADDQDTVGTFPAPPDPTGKVYCPLPPPPPPPTHTHTHTHPTPPPQFRALLITDVTNLLAINTLSTKKKLYISSLRSDVSVFFSEISFF